MNTPKTQNKKKVSPYGYLRVKMKRKRRR